MTKKTKRVFPTGLALAILLGAMLACNLSGSKEEQTPLPDAAGTVHAPLVPLAWFIESDCPTQGLSGLTFNGSAGALDCSYHWTGKFGADNAEMTVMQYTDSDQYQQAIDSDLGHRQDEIATMEAPQSASSFRKNDHVDIIQEDNNDFIYIETYNGSPSIDNPEIPLCGDGWGSMGVQGKFEVSLELTDSCDISTNAVDYGNVMKTMRDAALAAISRAEKNMTP